MVRPSSTTAMTLSTAARAIVDATAPAVAGNIHAIVAKFYSKLLSENPSLKAFFNMSNQKDSRQGAALAHGVLAAVAHLDNLNAIKKALMVMSHKHCALGVEAEQYKIVHDTFLAATAEVLGDAVTAEVAAAWSEVLMLVAGALIAQEEEIYVEAEKRPGGWRGVKEFSITKICEEGENVRSIWFSPKDGSASPEFTPGQYITVCENPTDQEHLAPRHYTISSDTELRISVKRIQREGQPDGIMSSYLHSLEVGDTVRLRPPFGTATHESYFPKARADAVSEDPTTAMPFEINHGTVDTHVFIAGGIGITPVRALAAVSAGRRTRMVVLHANSGNQKHPLQDEIQELVDLSSSSQYIRGNRSVVSEESLRAVIDQHGLDIAATHLYMCAPGEMTEAVLGSLAGIGWEKRNIHVDFFGPKGATAGRCPV